MCRWGCSTVDTTYMCKWCGTRYCKECLHGDFIGFTGEKVMKEPTTCAQCYQPRCQGSRVEYVPRPKGEGDGKGKRGTSAKSRSGSAKRGKSAKPKSAKGKKGKGKKKK